MRPALTTSSIICLLFLPLIGMAQMGIPDSTFNSIGVSRLTRTGVAMEPASCR
ncbi:MAG: hypothetical protein IPG92_17925 [Flavobacteriales bacterium]|nr:hypothetical protein [Flavobacteriales bacterium]